jgi:hypothetical protein
VGGEIVHDDDVARLEYWCEELLDVSPEDEAIHGTVDHAGRRDSSNAQSGNECSGFPMAVGQPRIETVATPAAPISTCHVRCRSGFINEHKMIGGDPRLILSPGSAYFGDVRTVLLSCEHAFF